MARGVQPLPGLISVLLADTIFFSVCAEPLLKLHVETSGYGTRGCSILDAIVLTSAVYLDFDPVATRALPLSYGHLV